MWAQAAWDMAEAGRQQRRMEEEMRREEEGEEEEEEEEGGRGGRRGEAVGDSSMDADAGRGAAKPSQWMVRPCFQLPLQRR